MNEQLLNILMQLMGQNKDPNMTKLFQGLKTYFEQDQKSQSGRLNADPLSMIDPYRVNSAWSYQKGGETKETVWSKFLKGMSSLAPGVSGMANMLSSYGSLNPLNPIGDISSPTGYLGNIAQAAYDPNVTIGEAVKGVDVERPFLEELFVDPLAFAGAPLAVRMGKAVKAGFNPFNPLPAKEFNRIRDLRTSIPLIKNDEIVTSKKLDKLLKSNLTDKDLVGLVSLNRKQLEKYRDLVKEGKVPDDKETYLLSERSLSRYYPNFDEIGVTDSQVNTVGSTETSLKNTLNKKLEPVGELKTNIKEKVSKYPTSTDLNNLSDPFRITLEHGYRPVRTEGNNIVFEHPTTYERFSATPWELGLNESDSALRDHIISRYGGSSSGKSGKSKLEPIKKGINELASSFKNIKNDVNTSIDLFGKKIGEKLKGESFIEESKLTEDPTSLLYSLFEDNPKNALYRINDAFKNLKEAPPGLYNASSSLSSSSAPLYFSKLSKLSGDPNFDFELQGFRQLNHHGRTPGIKQEDVLRYINTQLSDLKFNDKRLPPAKLVGNDILIPWLSIVKKQQGGAVNETGYTPGTPTMNNPFNIIPGGNITMKDTPFNVLGIPMYGNQLGTPQLMNPGQNYNFPGAKGVLEIPQMQRGGPIHPFIEAIRKMFSKNDVVDNPIPPGTMLPEVNLYGHRDKKTNEYLNVMTGKTPKYTEEELEERRKKALKGKTLDEFFNNRFNESYKGQLETYKKHGYTEKAAIEKITDGEYSADSFDKIDKKQFVTNALKAYYSTGVNPEDVPLLYEDSDPDVLQNKLFNPAYYRAVWEMNLRNGNPKIRDYNDVWFPPANRSYYNPGSNTMVLQESGHWIPELTHAQQYSTDYDKWIKQSKEDDKKFGYSGNVTLQENPLAHSAYLTPGTTEYDAHHDREPVLYRQLDSLQNVFRNPVKQQVGGPAGIGFSNLAKKLFGNNTKEPEASKEYQQWINSDPRILKSEINTKLIGDLINQKSAIRSEDFYTDKDETIPLTEGYLRGAKLPVKLVEKAKKVGEKYGVDPLDILAIAAKESTFGYSPFAEERWGSSKDHRSKTMDFENGMSEQGIFTFNDIIHGMKPIPYPEFLYRKGDKRINPIKTFHGYEYDYDPDTGLDIYSEDENVKEYMKYLEKYQPKKVDIMEEVAKRIKEKGIASYNPGQKNYAEMVEKYKKLLMTNKTPIKFQQGGYAMQNFLLPTANLIPDFSKAGLSSYFNDPMLLPHAKGGGFFGNIWSGIKKGVGAIGKGVGAFADQGLSFLGMPDVIKNSTYDQAAPNWMKQVNSGVGSVASGILGAAIPGAGLALGGLRGLIGSGNNMGGGANPFGGLNLSQYNEPEYNSGSLLAGLMPGGGGQQQFGTALGQLLGNFQGRGQFGGIGAGLQNNPFATFNVPFMTPTFSPQPMSFQEGGPVEATPQLTPIQTEKGEYFIHLDGSITPVNADEKHKKMDDDDVTDVIPEGTYVASNDKNFKLKKKDVEDMVMGIKTFPYKEDKKGKMPEYTHFSKLFGTSNKLTPAEMTKKVKDMFPTVDKSNDHTKNDIFTQMTNEENIKARMPWLDVIIQYNEFMRNSQAPQYQQGGSVSKHQNGGFGQVLGDIAGIAGSAIPFLQDLFGQNKNTATLDPISRNMILGSAPLYGLGLTQNIRAQQSALGQGIQDFTGLGQNLNQFAMGQAGANILGTQLQQTDYERWNPQAQQTRLANFNTRTPQSFVDALTPKVDYNTLAATLGSRGFNTFAGQLAGQQMNARNQVAMNQFNQDRGMSFGIMGQQNALDTASQQFNFGQAEKEMAAKNAQTAGTFGNIGSLFGRLGDIQSQILPITTQMNLQRASLSGQIPMGIAQNMMNVGSVYGTLNQQGVPQAQPPQTGSGVNYQGLRNILFGSNQNTGNPIGNNFSQIGNMIGSLFPGLTPAPNFGPLPEYDNFGRLKIQ